MSMMIKDYIVEVLCASTRKIRQGLFYLTLIFCPLVACSSPVSDERGVVRTDSAGPPVESRKPNAGYTPYFAGQTRIAGVKTKTPYKIKLLTESLNRPWGITTLPDGRLLITEKSGNMRISTTDGKLGGKITGLPSVNPNGQGGLLGLALDPAFAENRMVYWVYSENSPAGNLTAVAKGRLSADEQKIEGAVVIYRATPAYEGTLHYGGRIVFDGRGNLFVSTGERSDREVREQAQSLNSSLGKILRITKDGKAASGNPFMERSDARKEIYSYGHRNVQGLALNPQTGELWSSEFGPRGGDELNRILAGKNYGWPVITYGEEYSGAKVGQGKTRQSGMEQPVYYWDPVLSPSGMTFYTKGMISEWENNLFICGLNSNHVARLVISENKVIGEERLLSDDGQRYRDICQGKDGALYVITDEGRLYKVGN
jgi:glucose/arabinose dehydrogenase